MKRLKYPSSTTHSIKILKYIVGSTTRNASFKIFTLWVVQLAIHFKKILYFYIAGCTTRKTNITKICSLDQDQTGNLYCVRLR